MRAKFHIPPLAGGPASFAKVRPSVEPTMVQNGTTPQTLDVADVRQAAIWVDVQGTYKIWNQPEGQLSGDFLMAPLEDAGLTVINTAGIETIKVTGPSETVALAPLIYEDFIKRGDPVVAQGTAGGTAVHDTVLRTAIGQSTAQAIASNIIQAMAQSTAGAIPSAQGVAGGSSDTAAIPSAKGSATSSTTTSAISSAIGTASPQSTATVIESAEGKATAQSTAQASANVLNGSVMDADGNMVIDGGTVV